MESVELGDLVVLKSGGPVMTVMKIFRTNQDGQIVSCGYFLDYTYHVIGEINVKALKKPETVAEEQVTNKEQE